MRNEDKQLLVNAKSDEAALKKNISEEHENNLVCSDELFHKDLRAIVDDTMREHN